MRNTRWKLAKRLGKAAVLSIEPLDTIGDIIEKQNILLFTPQSIIEKLRDEKGDGKFVRIKGNGGEGMEQAHIGKFLQLEFWSDISLNLQYCQRLEELLFHLPFGRLGQADDKRKSTVATGEHIDDESRFPIL